MALVLILDDEQPLLQSLSMEMRRGGHQCLLAETGREALQLLEQNSPNIAILDVQLPDMSGLDVLRRAQRDMPEMPVLIVTAYASVDTAVEAMKEGAIEYLEKPLDLEELRLVVQRELRNARNRSDVEAYRRDHDFRPDDLPLLGESLDMVRIRKTVDQLASLDTGDAAELPTVLIEGETGTGKTLIARHIHARSTFAERPFVRVNCTGLSAAQLEGELFGREQDAAGGSRGARQGLFELAGGGTIFLDEIGDMGLEVQAKLLNVIEGKLATRIGGTREHSVEARIIAATQHDLEREVEDGSFRADLYYRLKVVHLALTRLRDRSDDIPYLARHFLDRYTRKYRRSLRLDDEGLAALGARPWPGNVRELEHTIENLVLTTEGPKLIVPPVSVAADGGKADSAGKGQRFDFSHEPCTLEEVQKALIREALAATRGNVSETARLLGVTRGSLRRRMERWHIAIP